MPSLNLKGFPEDLYHSLCEQAKKDRRSITGEAIYLLEWALSQNRKTKGSVLRLRGLGKKYWKDLEASEYITLERDSWE